jgi:Zn-dependent peptidase ImmA (M78 family)/DNA-binding XRE family transcriptional regulator
MAAARPELITLAREAAGLSQRALANKSGVSQAQLSRVEAGVVPADTEVLDALAKALDTPVEMFFRLDHLHLGGACFKYRKRASTGVRNLRAIEAQSALRGMSVASLLRAIDLEPAYEFPKFDVGDDGDYATPSDAANRLRGLWGLPRGPIANITSAIESAGALVINSEFDTPLVDAMSSWTPPNPPLLFVNRRLPGDRLRHTLAHEVAHLTMHHRPSPNEEAEADEFAAELLMPAAEIRPYLRNLTLDRAASLKIQWKVSMASLVVRAQRLGVISDERYRFLNIELARNRWKRQEPNPLPVEVQTLFEKILRYHIDELRYSRDDLARLMTVTPKALENMLGEATPPPGPGSLRAV